jgi:hypothetical protein
MDAARRARRRVDNNELNDTPESGVRSAVKDRASDSVYEYLMQQQCVQH